MNTITLTEKKRAEGFLNEPEILAIFLACGHNIKNPPESKVELLALWQAKDESKRAAYLRRAERLLKAWRR